MPLLNQQRGLRHMAVWVSNFCGAVQRPNASGCTHGEVNGPAVARPVVLNQLFVRTESALVERVSPPQAAQPGYHICKAPRSNDEGRHQSQETVEAAPDQHFLHATVFVGFLSTAIFVGFYGARESEEVLLSPLLCVKCFKCLTFRCPTFSAFFSWALA